MLCCDIFFDFLSLLLIQWKCPDQPFCAYFSLGGSKWRTSTSKSKRTLLVDDTDEEEEHDDAVDDVDDTDNTDDVDVDADKFKDDESITVLMTAVAAAVSFLDGEYRWSDLKHDVLGVVVDDNFVNDRCWWLWWILFVPIVPLLLYRVPRCWSDESELDFLHELVFIAITSRVKSVSVVIAGWFWFRGGRIDRLRLSVPFGVVIIEVASSAPDLATVSSSSKSAFDTEQSNWLSSCSGNDDNDNGNGNEDELVLAVIDGDGDGGCGDE
jgi:hypothetical protein